MKNYIYVIIFIVGGFCLPSLWAEPLKLDDGLTTIRVVEIAEKSRTVICMPVGIRVHAPENADREPIIMRVGADVAVNGQVSILASSTETEELNRRIIQELGPEYTIDYCKNHSWGLEVKTGEISLATRPMMEGSLSGWAFMAMIPAEMASPAVSLTFTGEIRGRNLKKAAGSVRSTRTITMSGVSTKTSGGDSQSVSQTVSTADTVQEEVQRKSRLSSATFPLTGIWEKTITPAP